MHLYEVGDVVQFNERHKWCGCLGIINEAKKIGGGEDADVRYMIGVPIPQQGTAYIFTMDSKREIEFIGPAILVPASGSEEGADNG